MYAFELKSELSKQGVELKEKDGKIVIDDIDIVVLNGLAFDIDEVYIDTRRARNYIGVSITDEFNALTGEKKIVEFWLDTVEFFQIFRDNKSYGIFSC